MTGSIFKFQKALVTLLLPIFILSVPLAVSAANCTKKPDHPDCVDPPPDDGTNDTADPDWKILAIDDTDPTTIVTFIAESDCYAFNPDLKGPGIAYLGFYDHDGYTTCAHTTTIVAAPDSGTVIDLRRLDIKTDREGAFTTIQLSGRNPQTGVIFESRARQFEDTGQPGPTDEIPFTLKVRKKIEMFSCNTDKMKGNTVCEDPAGTITLGDLRYCPLGSSDC